MRLKDSTDWEWIPRAILFEGRPSSHNEMLPEGRVGFTLLGGEVHLLLEEDERRVTVSDRGGLTVASFDAHSTANMEGFFLTGFDPASV